MDTYRPILEQNSPLIDTNVCELRREFTSLPLHCSTLFPLTFLFPLFCLRGIVPVWAPRSASRHRAQEVMLTARVQIYSNMDGPPSPPRAPLSSEAMRTKKGNEPPGVSAAPKCWQERSHRFHQLLVSHYTPPARCSEDSLPLSLSVSLCLSLTHAHAQRHIERSVIHTDYNMHQIPRGVWMTLETVLAVTLLFLKHLFHGVCLWRLSAAYRLVTGLPVCNQCVMTSWA